MIHAGGRRHVAVAVTAEARVAVDLGEVVFSQFLAPQQLANAFTLVRDVLKKILRPFFPPTAEDVWYQPAILYLLFKDGCEIYLYGAEAVNQQAAIESCNEQRFKDASDERIRRETPVLGSA